MKYAIFLTCVTFGAMHAGNERFTPLDCPPRAIDLQASQEDYVDEHPFSQSPIIPSDCAQMIQALHYTIKGGWTKQYSLEDYVDTQCYSSDDVYICAGAACGCAAVCCCACATYQCPYSILGGLAGTYLVKIINKSIRSKYGLMEKDKQE